MSDVDWSKFTPVDGSAAPSSVDWSQFTPLDESGGLIASAKQSAGSLVKGAGQFAADYIPGVDRDNSLKRYGQEVIDANPTAVHSLSDIADKPGTAIAEATGNAGSSVAGIVGARVAGNAITAAAPLTGPFAPATAILGQAVAWLGPAAIAALPSYGGIRDKQILNDPANEESAKAKAIATLGAATVGAIETKFGPQEWALSALTKEGRAKLAEKFAETTLAKSIGFGMGKGALIEGGEELVQNPVEQLASFDNPLTPESLKDTAFSGAMGALGGGVLGGSAGVIAPRAKPPAAEPQPDTGDVALTQSVDNLRQATDVYLRGPGPAEIQAAVLDPNVDLDGMIETVNASADASSSLLTAAAGLRETRRQGAQLTEAMDRQMELTAEQNAAGTTFEQENVAAQAATALGQANPAMPDAPPAVALTRPTDERTAKGYLTALREEEAQAGGDPSLVQVGPHPTLPNRFAVLRTQPAAVAPAPGGPTAEEKKARPIVEGVTQNKIESAALTGTIANRKAEDAPRQVVLSQALKNIEERGGVASPEEAQIVAEAGVGKPYDRIDPTLSRQLTTDEKLTQATGIALDKAPRSNTRQTPGPAESEQVAAENNARSDSRMQGLAAQKAAAAAAPAPGPIVPTSPPMTSVMRALLTAPFRRSAEQKATLAAARSTYSVDDMRVLEAGVNNPSSLSATDKLRLRTMQETKKSEPRENKWQVTDDNLTKEAAERIRAQREKSWEGYEFKIVPSQFHENGTYQLESRKLSADRGGSANAETSGKAGVEPAPVQDVEQVRTVAPESLPPQSKAKPGEMSRQKHDFIKQIARVFGKKVVVFESDDARFADGFVKTNDSKTIYLNRDSDRAHLVVFGHELMHQLKAENPAAYEAIRSVLKIREQEKFKDAAGIKGDAEELISDLQGDMFADTAFWADVFRSVAKTSGNKAAMQLGARIMRSVKSFIRALQGVKTFDSAAMVENMAEVRDAITKALATYAVTQRDEAVAQDRADNAPVPEQNTSEERVQTSDKMGPPTKREMATRRARLEMGDKPSAKRSAWDEDRLDRLMSKYAYTNDDNKTKAYAGWVSPEDFLKATTPLGEQSRIAEESTPLDPKELRGQTQEIFLEGRIDPENKFFRVTGHEGRHRMYALAKEGVRRVPVVFYVGTTDNAAELSSHFATPQQFSQGKAEGGFLTGTLTPVSWAYHSQLQDKFLQPAEVLFSDKREGQPYDLTDETDVLPRGDSAAAGNDGADGRGPARHAFNGDAVHFSREPRATLDGRYNGAGLKGAEAERLSQAKDARIKERVYFYVDEGSGIRPEAGVGGVPHRVSLSNLYNVQGDPLKLFKSSDLNGSESRVLDAGFDGYYFPNYANKQGIAIVMGPASRGMQATVIDRPNSALPAETVVRPYRHGLLSREINALDLAAVQRVAPSARINSGTFQVDMAELPAARAAAAEQGVTLPEMRLSRKRDELNPDIVQTLGRHIRSLTPPERAKLRRDTAKKLVDIIESLPSANEMAATAYAGRAKRGWYHNSAQAIEHVFGGDAPRFAALLAALSPQTSVEINLLNTLNVWKNWVQAGRPSERGPIVAIMGRSVQGDKGDASVLDAWKNNTVRALGSEDPSSVTLSGPKVNSFMLNLRGYVDEVTNDAWMSNYALVNQKIFAGSLNAAGDEPGKGPGYLAMSARVRETARTLTRLTGDEWTPAEVQETIWSWAKTLYETASVNYSAVDTVLDGGLTDDLINSTPDFRTLFHDDVNEQLLRDAGLGDAVASLRTRDDIRGSRQQGLRAEGEAAPFDRETQARYEVRAAKRLDKLRELGDDAKLSEKRTPFYSALSRSIEGISTRAAPAAGWKDAIKGLVNKGAVKQDEVNWSGVNEWLDLQGGKVTKDQVQAYLDANGVKVDELMYGSPAKQYVTVDEDGFINARYDTEDEAREAANAFGLAWDEAANSDKAATKYEGYQLPGGTNYRELLLTLPDPEPSFAVDDFIDKMVEKYGREAIYDVDGVTSTIKDSFPAMLSPEDRNAFAAALSEQERSKKDKVPFQSGHWSPKNVLAHVRFNERQDVTGARVLFIEELQSDWGQAGKKQGFSAEPQLKPGNRLQQLENGRWVVYQAGRSFPVVRNDTREGALAAAVEMNAATRSSIPTAPFVTKTESWLALGLKRVIKYAVDNGFEKVAFVNGDQSADRYDLSKQVDELQWSRTDGKYNLKAKKRAEGFSHDLANDVPEDQLAEYVGKELAQRIISEKGRRWTATYSGVDLKVGGEGMKAFYDKIVPTVAKDVVRKLGGGALEQVNMTADPNIELDKWVAEDGEGDGSKAPVQQLTQTGFTITDAMRAKAAEGVPLFSEKRVVGASSRQYTPQQQKMFERMGRTVEVPSLSDRLKAFRQDWAKRWAQGIADQFAPIKDLTKDGYMLARLSKGTAGALEAFMHHGKLKLTSDGVYDADRTGGAVERVFQPLQGEGEDFLWWVAANRAERLSAEDRERLFTPADIAAGKSLDKGTTDFDYTLRNGTTTRDRSLIFRDALKNFEEFNRNALDMAEQSGLIDGASRQFWEHEFYVPFYRVSGESGGFIGANIGQALVRQQAFKRLKGGEGKLHSDLLANTLQNWAHLIDASAKNRAAKATLEAAAAQGVAVEAPQATIQSMSGAGGKPVWFMDAGVKRHFLVDDPYLVTAIQSLDFAGMKGPIMNAMSTMKHWLTVGVTASPAFKIRNLIRDSMQAIASSELSYNPVANVIQGYKASDPKGQTYVSALAGGGLIRFGTMLEGRASDRVRQLVKMGVDESTILNSPSKLAHVRNMFEKGFMAYSEIGNRGEEINRAALYEQLIKKGVPPGEAALQARDLMDFSMQGSWEAVRFLSQVVPFFNARIQGMYKLGRSAKDDPQRFATVLGAVAVVSLGLLAAYHDDDDWKKREDWDREGFWWFKVGSMAFRIPKPFEIGTMASVAERAAELVFDKEMTQGRFLKRLKEIAYNNLSMNPVPQLAKPIVDLYANKNSFTGRPIETTGMEKLEPQYRFTGSTSMVARAASTASGGAASPVQIDHMIQGYFGWLGATAVGAADALVRSVSKEPSRPSPDWYKVGSMGFVNELPTGQSRYVTQLYEQSKELEQAYGTWRALLKQGKTEDALVYFRENRDEIVRYKSLEKVKSAEAKFNEQIRMVERSSMDPDAKKARIRTIQRMKDQAARVVVAR